MRLRVKYRSKPDFAGFQYAASDEAEQKGEDACKKELKAAMNYHNQNFQWQKQLFGKEHGNKKIEPTDIEAWIEDDGGNRIETLS